MDFEDFRKSHSALTTGIPVQSGVRLFPPSETHVLEALEKNVIKILGQGNGHGVGMCQIGALDLAKKGMDFKKILKHYFPDHKIKKIF